MLKLQRKVQRLQEELTDKLRYVRVPTAARDADGMGYRSIDNTTPSFVAVPHA